MLSIFAGKVLAENGQLRDALQGKLTEYEDDLETIQRTDLVFTSIRLDVKLRTFEAAF